MRLTTKVNGQHHVTIPDHQCLRVGTVASIVVEVAAHLKMDAQTLRAELFG